MSGVKAILGGGAIAVHGQQVSLSDAQRILDTCSAHGVNTIDTARVYGESEAILGKINAIDHFLVDTKHPGGTNPGHSHANEILEVAEQQFKLLGVTPEKPVDVYYMHAPDTKTPVESTVEGINELHKRGLIKRFGLSNYTAEQVREVYDTCKKHGWITPTVFQGNYSAVLRQITDDLLPTLRELGISFNAYSPLAGGFLTKTKEQVLAGQSGTKGENHGRFVSGSIVGDIYLHLFNRPAYVDCLATWAKIAEEAGISKADLGFRWIKYHSVLKAEHGDGFIFGGSVSQIEKTLKGLEAGPLDEKTVKAVNALYNTLRDEESKESQLEIHAAVMSKHKMEH